MTTQKRSRWSIFAHALLASCVLPTAAGHPTPAQDCGHRRISSSSFRGASFVSTCSSRRTDRLRFNSSGCRGAQAVFGLISQWSLPSVGDSLTSPASKGRKRLTSTPNVLSARFGLSCLDDMKVIGKLRMSGDEQGETAGINEEESDSPTSTSTRTKIPVDEIEVNGAASNSSNVTEEIDMLPESPPLTFPKFITMQDKRVVVTIRYSGGSGLRPYFLTAAKRIKDAFPDVIVEKLILPSAELVGDDSTFELLVDEKLVIGKVKNRGVRGGSGGGMGVDGVKSVFVSMQELEFAISKARKRRRPSTLYMIGDADADGGGAKRSSGAAMRLEALRRGSNQRHPKASRD